MFYNIVAFLLSANEVWGKVMFLHLSDCPWSHVPSEGGVSVWVGGSLSGVVDLCLLGRSLSIGRGGKCPWGISVGRLPPPPQSEKQAVRILLECFLVYTLRIDKMFKVTD